MAFRQFLFLLYSFQCVYQLSLLNNYILSSSFFFLFSLNLRTLESLLCFTLDWMSCYSLAVQFRSAGKASRTNIFGEFACGRKVNLVTYIV